MKNNYSRLVIIALITIIVFLYALTIKGYATGLPAALQETITGVVTDEQAMPLPGVTVTVKGTNRGTSTNIDGEYEIEVDAQGILVFSFMGFKKAEVAVAGRREINLSLIEDITALDQVEINAGYYNTTRRESTGNISRVTAEEIELQPVVSPLEALQGRMAGVEVISGGSHPGMAPTIRIRGTNSLREEGNYPLYIIDGVPIFSTPIESNTLLGSTGAGIDPLNHLDLNNIKSIEVLKDADATAIYGSRGANGVVLITTKKGTGMGTGLEVKFHHGVAKVPERLDLLNTEEYITIRRRAFENDGVEKTEWDAYDLVLWDQERYTDWQEFLFGGTAEITNANLSFSGGDENTSFRLGGSYLTQGTVYPGDYDYQKLTGNLNLNHRSENNNLNITLSAIYGVDVNNLAGQFNGLDFSTILLPPNAPNVFNEDGEINWDDWGAAGLDNPLAGYHNQSITESNSFLTNVGITYEIIGGLQSRLNGGYTLFNSEELLKRPSQSYNPAFAQQNHSFHLRSQRNSWILEPQLNYNQDFKEFNLDVILGATFQDNTGSQFRVQGSGYVSEKLIGNLEAAEKVLNASSQTTKYRYAAIFGRIGTNWEKKYFINFTGRRDGSSRFGPNKRFSNFAAIGTAWIFSEEEFISKNLPVLSFGKIRASYGTTGNDQIGDYGYFDAYEATPGQGGLYPTVLANPNYSWEINKKLEAAMELSLFKDQLHLEASWYRNRSSNQLVGYPLPAITGFTSVQANLPATVQNSGWEIAVTSINVSSENFYWETALNISFPKNELVSYPGIEQSSYSNTYRVGHPVNISLLYKYKGIDPETGLYTVTDINEDGLFDHHDRVVIQNRTREFFGGINNSVRYKNVSLQFLWEFVKQEGTLDVFNAGSIENQRHVVLGALNEPGKFQKISQSWQATTAYGYVLNSDFPWEDASFLRLKTLTMSYNLSEGLTKNVGLDSGKLFISGQNLVTITPYKGLDPDLPNSGTSFANLQTVTAGVQFNF